MGRAKEIIVKVIPAKIANEFVKKYHYSGKKAQNPYLNLGCFLDEKLHGVMQFGPSLDKSKIIGLVKDAKWNDFIELNRMAFDDYLPKNSESRCLSISFKLIKKFAPHIKWIISFSDGTQSGDGCIYRAAGFYLTGVKENTAIWELPNGEKVCQLIFNASYRDGGKNSQKVKWGHNGSESGTAFLKRIGAKKLNGFQLRYIYLIDKTCKITVPILPFSKIDEMGAGMYKGKKVSLQSRKETCADGLNKSRGTSSIEMAVIPTSAL
jgi:hypothetical protein